MMKTKSHVKKSNKPFCKVCFDTGKSEHEYRSHYVKNVPGPNGVVVCPTILSVECRYCKSIGHTVSKCPSLKSKSSSSSSHHDRKGYKHRENSHNTAANDVAEEEDKTMEIEIEPPPPLPLPPPDNHKYEMSYANIVSKQPTTTTTTTTVVKEKEKEKRTPMKLSIIDPNLLENTNHEQKSHTPLCSPPSHIVRMKQTTTISKFKKKQIIIQRWPDNFDTDMSDYE